MLANLMKVAGVDHVITIDLHASQMQGFFKCPVDNLLAEPLIAKWIKINLPDWQDAVVVSKNPGGTKRVTSLADAMKLSFGIITTDRRRPYNTPSMMNSAIFESIGTDGTNEQRQLEEEEALQCALTPERTARQRDFGQRNISVNGDQRARRVTGQRTAGGVTSMSPRVQTRLVNGDIDSPSSPLANSTRPESMDADDGDESPPNLTRRITAMGISQTHDDDGYEESAGEEDSDEVSSTFFWH